MPNPPVRPNLTCTNPFDFKRSIQNGSRQNQNLLQHQTPGSSALFCQRQLGVAEGWLGRLLFKKAVLRGLVLVAFDNFFPQRHVQVLDMVLTRNQRVRGMWRGPLWRKDDEAACYNIFFEICRRLRRVHDHDVFNSIWALLAEELFEVMGEMYTEEVVRSKIHLLRTHFNAFKRFSQLPGVRFDLSDIDRVFRLDGFPLYRQCNGIFVTKRAAEIDFGSDSGDAPGSNIANPLLVDDSDEHLLDIEEFDISIPECGCDYLGPFPYDVNLACGLGAPVGPDSSDDDSDGGQDRSIITD